jgi:hypothetical protein
VLPLRTGGIVELVHQSGGGEGAQPVVFAEVQRPALGPGEAVGVSLEHPGAHALYVKEPGGGEAGGAAAEDDDLELVQSLCGGHGESFSCGFGTDGELLIGGVGQYSGTSTLPSATSIISSDSGFSRMTRASTKEAIMNGVDQKNIV